MPGLTYTDSAAHGRDLVNNKLILLGTNLCSCHFLGMNLNQLAQLSLLKVGLHVSQYYSYFMFGISVK